jgi:hypothetical protein
VVERSLTQNLSSLGFWSVPCRKTPEPSTLGEKMMQGARPENNVGDDVDHTRRQALRRLAVGAAFVAPLVTSVSIDGLTISKVYAGSASSSGAKKKDHCKDVSNGGEKFNEGGCLPQAPA